MSDVTLGALEPLKLLSPHIVADRCSLSVRTLQRMVKTGQSPIPVRLSRGRIAFYEHEVQDWMRGLARTRETA